MNVYLQTKDGADVRLDKVEFFRNNRSFGFGKISKGKATELLDKAISEIRAMLKDDDLHQLSLFSLAEDISFEAVIFQEFFNYYSEKLNEILCNKTLNPKYIKATGNPAVANLSAFNILKVNDGISIKGFLYGSLPEKDQLYITTTCGTGGTSLLFQSIKDKINEGKNEYADITYIKLDSIEKANTIGFYGKLGFYKTNKESASILKDMIKNIYMKRKIDFNQYINKTKKIVGGSMYWFKENSQGKKKQKELHCDYIYTPEVWYNNLKVIKDSGIPKNQAYKKFTELYKKERLEGAGFGDWLKRGWNYLKEGINRVKEAVTNTYDYSNKSKDTIQKYGNDNIIKLQLVRQPIQEGLNLALDLMTKGKWSDIKKKYGFDKLFHLSLIATVRHQDRDIPIIMEKNEVINISDDFKIGEAGEYKDVELKGPITILQLLSNARNKMGDKLYFSYDAFENNCQYFIKALLENSGLLTTDNYGFVFQDIKDIVREIPKTLPLQVRAITWLGAFFSKLMGKGPASAEPLDQKLYDKVKKEIYKKNPKHSLFRSAQVVKEYKDRGGKYRDSETDFDIDRWFKQQWISLNDYYHTGKIVPCGSSDTEEKFDEYPLCRPLELAKKLGKKNIGKMIEEKKGPEQLKTSDVLGTEKYNIKTTLSGTGNDGYELHAVIFKKPYGIEEAKKKAQEFIKGKKHFYRETGTSYRFRNIPKTKFAPKTFRSKKVDPNITLVFGKVKP